eukprot:CAMPEP_0170568622 /NCGR_PEP_ID=MMETSP0224-20130122/49_1 /TAXON_ID=285029 /ORGANISM="Togula jolla, Strain CCCM 725" /LENGTH=190 /DNA_ID=CAMNT_0010890593 /DNA_START=322 /DNA_END=898 /DNA_ORIENTATION=+
MVGDDAVLVLKQPGEVNVTSEGPITDELMAQPADHDTEHLIRMRPRLEEDQTELATSSAAPATCPDSPDNDVQSSPWTAMSQRGIRIVKKAQRNCAGQFARIVVTNALFAPEPPGAATPAAANTRIRTRARIKQQQVPQERATQRRRVQKPRQNFFWGTVQGSSVSPSTGTTAASFILPASGDLLPWLGG